MKKLTLLIALFITSLSFAQLPPAYNPDGYKAPFVIYEGKTTVELNAYSFTASDRVIAYDTTLSKWREWNGTAWADFGGSVDLSNYVTLDGTQTITGSKTISSILQLNDDLNIGTGAEINLSNGRVTGLANAVTSTDAVNKSQLDAAVAGLGDVTKVGVPVDNQIGIWTGDGTIEGDTGLTWNGTSMSLNGSSVPRLSVNNTTNFRSTAIWSDNILFTRDGFNLTLQTPTLTGNYTLNLPALTANSTVALTSDIPNVDDTAYGVSWNANTDAATKNAIYDKLESLAVGGDVTKASDTDAYTEIGTDIADDHVINIKTAHGGQDIGLHVDGTLNDEFAKLEAGSAEVIATAVGGHWVDLKSPSGTYVQNKLSLYLGVTPSGINSGGFVPPATTTGVWDWAMQDKSYTVAGLDDIPTISDAVYGAGWNGNTDAATKNAIYDKIETIAVGGGGETLAQTTSLGNTTSDNIILTGKGQTTGIEFDNQTLHSIGQSGLGHLTIQEKTANSGTRFHLMPKGTVAGDGLASGLKMFATDWEADGLNYHDFGMWITQNDIIFNSKQAGTFPKQLPFSWRYQDTNEIMKLQTKDNAALMLGVETANQKDWTLFEPLHLGASTVLLGRDGVAASEWINNAYYDGSWKRIIAGESQRFSLDTGGDFVFWTAADGTADAAVAWSKKLTIENGGNLDVENNNIINLANPVNTGDAATKGYVDTNFFSEVIQIACSDLITDITTGTSKAYFRMPYAATLNEVRCSLIDAGTATGLTVDINEGGTTVLSTKLTTDATEKTSETAVTAAVISDSALADDAEITIDFDAVPTNGLGVIVTLKLTRS